MEGSRHALRVPWKTHRRVPTRGSTSSPAHGGLPTHGPCAFNRACSGPHHKPVRLQPPTQWFPLTGSAPSSTQRGFPLTGHAPSTARGWVLKAVGVPSTAHQEFPTCGLCTLNRARSGPHHKAMRSQLPRRVHSWATSSQLGTERSPLADPWVVCLQLLTQWFPPAVHAPSTAQEQSPLACSAPSAQTEGASWAARPHPHMEGTPPAGRAPSAAHRGVPTPGPSTGHGGVPTAVPMPSTEHQGLPTRGPCTLNHARSGSPHHKAVRPQLL